MASMKIPKEADDEFEKQAHILWIAANNPRFDAKKRKVLMEFVSHYFFLQGRIIKAMSKAAPGGNPIPMTPEIQKTIIAAEEWVNSILEYVNGG